jgi:hypothetical protein
LIVGFVGLQLIVHVHHGFGAVPPTSMFAAGASLISVLSMITVTLAARGAGVATRAAVALGGAFAAIAIAKFALAPNAFFRGTAGETVEDPFGFGGGGMMWAIAIAVGLLYVGVVLVLAARLRPREAASPRLSTGLVLIVLAVAAFGLGAFVTRAPIGYLGFALTGAGAAALAISLLVAATLIAAAFHDAATQARVLGTVSVYTTIVWVAVAFLLVFQVLWVVFLLAVVTLWPIKTVTPK